jgi:acetolactate synthase-1/2/3 large subunit
MAVEKTGAEIIWECLIREGVEVVFGYPGGAILPTYDALNRYPQIHHVLVRHEQGAAHAADGYARASGKVGVAIATSGPGASNLVTGVMTAMMDSSPIVCITGQVATPAIGTDAFQEADVVGLTMPVTKQNYLVTDVAKLAATLKEAFHIARSGRPGPVVVDVPKDVQNARTEFIYPEEPVQLPGDINVQQAATDEQVIQALKMINTARQPVILAGRGVLLSGAMGALFEIATAGAIPVATTLLGSGGFPASHPLCLGMMGMHGEAAANHAIQEADLLLAFGMRFDDRVTGHLATYAPQARKIHIDIDISELNKNVSVDLAVHADLNMVLNQLRGGIARVDRSDWLTRIGQWQADSQQRDVLNSDTGQVLLAAQVIHDIWRFTGGQAVVVTDVGQHQMLQCQYYPHDEPHTLISSGGAGTMGFALPAAIGARFGVPAAQELWVIAGDGSFQMTLMEMATAVQENSNINICIINNGFLGMVRQWQEIFYEKRYTATPISGPDFVKLAEAYGMHGQRVDSRTEVEAALTAARAHQGPSLIEFVVEQHDMVYPMVSPGAALDNMVRRPQQTMTLPLSQPAPAKIKS